MDVYFHTFIAVGCMLSTYILGRWMAQKEIISNKFVDHTVEHILKTLEHDGFIRTEIKGDEVELIPISEIVEKALEDKNDQKFT